MAAEKHGGVYEQTLDHDIISKFEYHLEMVKQMVMVDFILGKH